MVHLLAIALGRRRNPVAVPGGDLTPAPLALCRDYADSRSAGQLDLAGWAQSIGMTPSEFTRRFRRATHTPPYAWFLRRRIEAAKLLLAQADTSRADAEAEVNRPASRAA